jgi:hypothetical protein
VKVMIGGVESAGDEAQFWTFDMVEARLVETIHCLRRMPGDGRWPFASDGPWHLIRKQWEDWDARDPKPLRRVPLSRAEIRAMEEATEWLAAVADEDQRRIIVAGLIDRANGRTQTGWAALRARLQMPQSSAYLSTRYSRGIGYIANVLNAGSGINWAEKGRRIRYSKHVLDGVERLKAAEIRAGNVSSPVMFGR